MSESKKDIEVRKNFDAFRAMLPEISETHAGKFALLRNLEIVEFFDTPKDALLHAMHTYDDDLYSVQQVNKAVIDQGWFSHVAAHAAV